MLANSTPFPPLSGKAVAPMIELLTRLNAKGPGLIDNEPKYKHSQRCPVCHGGPKARIDCSRCRGSGRLHDTAGQSSTRVSTQNSITGQQIAALCGGAPEHKFWAGMVYVCDDPIYKTKLVRYLMQHVIGLAARNWKIEDEEERAQRVKGLALLAVIDLGYKQQRQHVRPEQAWKLIGCSRAAYYSTWRKRRSLYYSRVHEWVTDLEMNMYNRFYDRKKTG